ncbi:putative tyrosyl-DNA phosphodiesterase [Hibiscus syriacus]|uniref:Tyrosyl-DNA phosphodiesterase n=1 Tax=Hibiscus syriacus TaxID=106335 RepID=A0A6A3A0Z4_HIBSY|nr:putative tyrosyl-DNA phosphodiesterase [Hibiscus syriacus]
MDVIFETQRGKAFCIEVGFFDTVLEIKEKVQKYKGIPVHTQTLIFNGHVLQDERDVEYCEILQFSRIKLLVAPDLAPDIENNRRPSLSPLKEVQLNVDTLSSETSGFPAIDDYDIEPSLQSMDAHLQGDMSSGDGMPTGHNNVDGNIKKSIETSVPPEINDYDGDAFIQSFDAELQGDMSSGDCMRTENNNVDVNIKKSLETSVPPQNNEDVEAFLQSLDAELQGDMSSGDCMPTGHSNVDVSIKKSSETSNNNVNVNVNIKKPPLPPRSGKGKAKAAAAAVTGAEMATRGLKKMKLWVLPMNDTKKIPVAMNPNDNVGELRKELQKLQETLHFDLSEEGYFFIHKGNVMDDHRSFMFHHVVEGDTIEIFNVLLEILDYYVEALLQSIDAKLQGDMSPWDRMLMGHNNVGVTVKKSSETSVPLETDKYNDILLQSREPSCMKPPCLRSPDRAKVATIFAMGAAMATRGSKKMKLWVLPLYLTKKILVAMNANYNVGQYQRDV